MIYYLFKKDIGNKQKWWAFLSARFIRIYPFYWIILSCFVPVYFLVPSFGQGWETNPLVILKSYFLLPQPHSPVLGVAWSLVHTMCFYLLFSLLLLLPPKISRIITGCWFTITTLLALHVIEIDSIVIKYLFHYTLLRFALGCFIAHLIMQYRIKFDIALVCIGMIGFPLCWINHINKTVDIHLSLGYTLCAGLIILGLSSIDLRQQIKLPRFLNYLGQASFAIFLVNQPVISVLSKLFQKIDLPRYLGFVASSLLIMTVAVAIGCIVYSWVERPLINFLKVHTAKRTSTASSQPQQFT
ncbi:acyltransferase [Paenibacillaceae bacterium]|nr:acyltransferase [Paenibacillaceae bacterium]